MIVIRDLACWCAPFVECHADVLRAAAIGADPVTAAGSTPALRDSFRAFEEDRAGTRAEIGAAVRRRGRTKGFGAW